MNADTSNVKDFFVSYSSADKFYAMGIRQWLENAGHSTIMQQADFAPGSNFVLEMDRASKEAHRLIAVLSPDYLTSQFTAPEWAAMFRKDPTGAERRLIPVRIRECEITGLLRQIVYIDLVGLGVAQAEQVFLSGIEGRLLSVPAPPKKPAPRKPSVKDQKAPAITQQIKGDRNIQVGGDLLYNTKKTVKNVIEPGPEEISQKQASELLVLINELGQRDAIAGKGNTYGAWMNKFKKAFGVTSYLLLKVEQFDSAKKWIRQQKGMTRSRLRRPANEAWRREVYGSIWGAMRKLKWTKQQVYDLAFQCGAVASPITSLTQLQERQLTTLDDEITKLSRRKPK